MSITPVLVIPKQLVQFRGDDPRRYFFDFVECVSLLSHMSVHALVEVKQRCVKPA
jgi:hypothetical protein